MMSNSFQRAARFFAAFAVSLLPLLAFADADKPADDVDTVIAVTAQPVVINKSFSEIDPSLIQTEAIRQSEGIPPRQITNPDALLRPRPATTPKFDPLMERQSKAMRNVTKAFTTASVNVEGHFGACCPPDTVGEIGPTHFIQMTNGVGADGTTISIYDKAGTRILAPVSLEGALGSGACAAADGDPIPLYDQLANRWLLTQFETAGGPGVHGFCIYVSSGHDPFLGSWTQYFFPTQGAGFPDYPKYAVWPNAYYIGTNEGGPVYAIDRAKMLAGQPATMITRNIPQLAGFGFQLATPVDVAGPIPPPDGAPGIFVRHRDDESHNAVPNATQDYLEVWEFQPDFVTPANSTFTGPTNIPMAEFDSDLCGLTSFFCFGQPGTAQQLDPLREPVMQRPVYRNFGTYQSLVGNLTTDVTGGDQGGIRWFEMRRAAGVASGGWSNFQEGTVAAADGVNRWMGSLAMDKQGNMALGYSVSDANATFPGIRYTGRTVGATAGIMNQGETEIGTGAVSQTFSDRWGDYSAMTVDPVDDCTFWFTTEYLPAASADGSPRTRIAAFKYDACTALCAAPNSENLALSVEAVTTTQTYEVCNTVTVGPQYDINAGGKVTMKGQRLVFLNGVSVLGELVTNN